MRSASRCVSWVAWIWAPGLPMPPRICTTLAPLARGLTCIASTIASSAALHDEMPIISRGRRVVSR